LAADLVALAEAEAADRQLGLGDQGALAGDLRELLGGLLHAVLVLQGLADAHVDDDFLQPRQAQAVGAAELLHQLPDDLLIVPFNQGGHGRLKRLQDSTGEESRSCSEDRGWRTEDRWTVFRDPRSSNLDPRFNLRALRPLPVGVRRA